MRFVTISTIIAVVLIGGAFFLSGKNDSGGTADNVTIVDGVQIIDIRAKGGYSPRRSNAKAGIPTVLKVNTSSTFDCSTALRIPSMGVFKYLPQTGTTEFDLGSPQVGTLQGMCSMGMYYFEINFQS